MQVGLRRQTLLYAIIFCIISMGGMLFFAKNKAIEISNVAQDQVVDFNVFFANEQEISGPLRFRQEEVKEGYLCIPLEGGVKAESVAIENHYMERQVWIYIKGTNPHFYAQEAISGDLQGITEGLYEYAEDTTLIKFTLSEVSECKSILEEGHLYIDFVPPTEVYDRIVVIDAGCGGSDEGLLCGDLTEKEITLDIIKRLKSLLDNSGIKVYYTRTEDKTVSLEERITLANESKADMFIGVQLNASDNLAEYGAEAFYNGQYFIPGFGSIELADLVERSVVTEIYTKGNGLFEAEEDTLLQKAKIPATVIKVGYATNADEASLLQNEGYREKIAKGIYAAILAAYDKKNQGD